jgi:enoyl-CoA hydratase/carnithine racemase
MRVTLTGRNERLSAQAARDLGLVTDVIEVGRPRDEAQRLADTIARNSPAALIASKRAMSRMLQVGLEEGWGAAIEDITSMWGHPDQSNGPAVFVQRRGLVWRPLSARTVGREGGPVQLLRISVHGI